MGIIQDNSGTFTATGFSASLLAASDSANVVVLVICGEVTITTPGSWTLRTSQVNNMGHYWFERSGVSVTSVTVTTGAAGGGVWWMAELNGPFVNATGSNNIVSGTTYTTPNLTPTAGTRTIIAALGSLSPGGVARTLSGWTNSFVEVDDTLLSANVWPMQGVAALQDITANGSTAYATTGTYSNADNDSRTALIASYATTAASGFTQTPTDDTGLTDNADVVGPPPPPPTYRMLRPPIIAP